MITDFQVGRHVILQGIKSRPELNGDRATIVKLMPSRERVGVKLTSGESISICQACIRSAALPTPPVGLDKVARLEWVLSELEKNPDVMRGEGIDTAGMKKILDVKLAEARAEAASLTPPNVVRDADTLAPSAVDEDKGGDGGECDQQGRRGDGRL